MITDSRKTGSTILIAIIFTTVLTMLAGGVLARVVHERKMMQASVENASLLYVAEGYADKAILAVKTGDWTGFMPLGGDRYMPFTRVNMGNRSSWVHVYVKDAAQDERTIYAEAMTQLTGSRVVERQVRIKYTAETAESLPGGMIGRDMLDFSGQATFDAYDSSIGRPDPVTNRSDEVFIGTVSKSSTAFKLSGQVDIFGWAGTGKRNPEISGNENKILGENSASSEERKGNVDWARVSTDFVYEFPPIEQPSWSGAKRNYSGSKLGQHGTTTVYKLDKLEPGGKLKVRGKVILYAQDGVSVSGDKSIVIEENSSIEIYTPKDVTISGDAIVNLTQRPKNVKIYGTVGSAKDQSVTVSGNGDLTAVIYAPNAVVQVSGNNGTISGSVVGYEIKYSGQGAFHYDTSLGGTKESAGNPRVTAWHDMSRAPVDLEGEIKKAGGSYTLPF